MTDPEHHRHRGQQRYTRDTLEFGRVVNLSDGVFAIALTLLVFTLDASAVPLDQVDGVLIDQTGELIAFAISFVVIANFWRAHHRLMANLGTLEPGLIRLNLALLGAVALIPFPTSLLGRDPTLRGSVVPYLALLALVAIIHVLLLARAQSVEAWRHPLPAGLFPWLLAEWGATTFVTIAALVVALIVPLAGLAMMLLTWPIEALVTRRAPAAYRNWS